MISAIRSCVMEAMLLLSLILCLILFVVVPFIMATILTCGSWIPRAFGLGSKQSGKLLRSASTFKADALTA